MIKQFATNRAKIEQKDIINTALANCGDSTKPAVVLDGHTLGTTKKLIEFGWIKENIHIPNYSDDYSLIKRNHKNTYYMSLNNFLMTNSSREYALGLIYCDYMTPLLGDKYCRPMKDLAVIFNNRMLGDDSVLGVTLSARTGIINNTGFKYPDIPKLLNLVLELAIANGYYAVPQSTGGIYINGKPAMGRPPKTGKKKPKGSPMYTFLFKIYKVKRW